MDLTSLLTQAVIGAIGGNGAGAVLKDQSLGTVGNTIAGVLGGGIGGQLLNAVLGSGAMATAGAAAAGPISVGNIAGGGIGGAVLMIIVSVIRGMMNKSA